MEEWQSRFSEKRLDQVSLPEFAPKMEAQDIISLVVAAYRDGFGLTRSRGDARRLVEQGSVQLSGVKIRNAAEFFALKTGDVLRLDKTRAVRIK